MARGIRKSKLEISLKQGSESGVEISMEDCAYLALFPNGPDENVVNHIIYSEKARNFRQYLGIEQGRLEL